MLGSDEPRPSGVPRSVALLSGWGLLGGLGWLFVLVGGADLLLTFLPPSFGNPEWEFGSVTTALNGLPVPLMGLVLLGVWAVEVESRAVLRILTAVFILLGLALLGMAVFYALTLPLVAQQFGVPQVGLGLKRAVAKSLVQLAVYIPGCLWLGRRALKLAKSV